MSSRFARPALATLAFAAACGATSPAPLASGGTVGTAIAPATGATDPIVLGTGDHVIRGTITREATAYTRNDPLRADGHATLAIELRRYQGEDTSAPLAARATVTLPAGASFPLTYELHVDAALEPTATYFISADLRGTATAGGPLHLMSEYRNELTGDADRADFSVGGLEPCDSPSAGGFCG